MLRAVASAPSPDLDGFVDGPEPAASTDNALVRWDGTGGRTLQDSPQALLTDTGALTIFGTTAQAPGFYAGISTDTVARISLGINTSDVARIGFGPGGSTARETFITRGTGGGVAITNGTVTVSTPLLDLSQTWNDVAVTFTGLKLNVTSTASATASLLLDLQVGGATIFNIKKGGQVITANGSAGTPAYAFAGSANSGLFYSTGINFTLGGGAEAKFTTTSAFQLRSAATLEWSSGSVGAASDLILARKAAANLRQGAADAASPVAQINSVQNVVTGTSNVAGVAWTFAGSQSTGDQAGGSIVFQTSPLGSSGTSVNALATVLTLSTTAVVVASGKNFQLGNAAVTGLVAGALAALTTASIVIYDSAGQAYRIPCVI